MAFPREKILLLVDQLEDCYVEQISLKRVLIAYSEGQLPPWPEIQLRVSEARQTILESDPDFLKPFGVLRHRLREEPNLERAIEILLATFPVPHNPQ